MRTAAAFALTLLAGPVGLALAAELNISITSNGEATVVVEPGATVDFEVTGVLTDTDNEGLSFFLFDLTFEGGPLGPVDAPAGMPLTNFTPPEGFANPEGYEGAVIDGVLHQVGGSQNTLKSPLMTGSVITGLGHTPIVLATGSLTAPMADGAYTLTAAEILGRVIEDGDDGSGEIWATEWAFEGEVSGLQILIGPQCMTHGDCADLDDDGIRDDGCVWWSCSAGLCESTDVVFADMGGQFGTCPPDGTADGNDRFAALNCFANQNAGGSSPYDCEDAAPAAFNVDAGGAFGNCDPDGVCDGNDAFAALNAFEGTTSCSCSAGPQPVTAPVTPARAAIELRSTRKRLRPGGTISIEAYLTSPLDDLRGYQLHLGTAGGTRGHLDLVDISIDRRRDAVFAELAPWTAFNVNTGQMVAGLDSPGIRTASRAYLATFTWRASRDAAGPFRIELLADGTDSSQRTFVFRTDPRAVTEIGVEPVVVEVVAGEKRGEVR